MIITVLLCLAAVFLVSAHQLYEEWDLYLRYSLKDSQDKRKVFWTSVVHAVIMGTMAGAIYQIMFGGIFL